MTNPVTQAFLIGRATADALIEQIEDKITDLLSALTKYDAEQREKLREFVTVVNDKASRSVGMETASNPYDLQETIDYLRAEIAQLKVELQLYRENQVKN
jgi:protein-arginine kinase